MSAGIGAAGVAIFLGTSGTRFSSGPVACDLSGTPLWCCSVTVGSFCGKLAVFLLGALLSIFGFLLVTAGTFEFVWGIWLVDKLVRFFLVGTSSLPESSSSETRIIWIFSSPDCVWWPETSVLIMGLATPFWVFYCESHKLSSICIKKMWPHNCVQLSSAISTTILISLRFLVKTSNASIFNFRANNK